MALESASYISQLVPANPPASDPIAQAASHLNLIKTVLQDTFPNANAPITATVENLNNGTPVGLICLWSGSAIPAGWALCNGQTVARSDGSGNITLPDYRDCFIVAAGLSYALGATGGVAQYSLSTAQMPYHTHGVVDNGHTHGYLDYGHTHDVNDGGHAHAMPAGGVAQAGTDNGGASALSPSNQYGTYGGAINNTRSSVTGISLAAAATSITIEAAGTGLGITGTGSGAAIENRPPFMGLYYIMKV